MRDFFEDALLFAFVGVLALVAVIVLTLYVATKRQAKIINAEYGTHYTTADMFWAGDTIEETIIGNKMRVNLKKK